MFSTYAQNELRFADNTSPTNAEPMTMGSPVSSPKSKANASLNYLPPYLFGEAAPSPSTSFWESPKQNFVSPSSPFTTMPVASTSQYREPMYPSSLSSSIINTPTASKSGGPPIQGLLYSSTSPVSPPFNVSQIDTIPQTPSISGSMAHDISRVLTPSKSFSLNNSTFMSPAQIDPFYTQGDALKNCEQIDETWVTVFGFPAASASFILQQFSQYGNIVEQRVSPNGNWMHIRYQSKLQAKKALSKNGKIFSGNIMIGVKPCIEMDVMDSAKENSISDPNTSKINVSSPLNDSLYRNENTESTKPNLKNIRPLTQAFLSPQAPTQATTAKSQGIVSKAIDYLWKL